MSWYAEEDAVTRPPEMGMFATYDARTTNPRECQQKLEKLTSSVRHAAHMADLDQLPEDASPPEQDILHGAKGTRAFAKACHVPRLFSRMHFRSAPAPSVGVWR